MLKLIGGRLYQWDLGRRLEVHDLPDGTQITEVDFCHPGDAEALVVIPDRSGDTVTVDIPNILLQSDATIMIYECVGDVTVSKIPRSVVGRERPADYVYTETQVLTYKALEERIAKLEQGGVPEEQLAAAIAAYLEEHPIDAGLDEAALAAYLVENGYLTDADLADAIAQALAEAKASGQFDGAPGADGKDGADGQPGTNGKTAYQYAVDGGYTGTEEEFAAKLAEEMPDKLPNPNALTFSGAVTGSYDGSAPLRVEIPSGGGAGGEVWKLLSDETVTEDVTEYKRSFESVYRIAVLFYTPGGTSGTVDIRINGVPNSMVQRASINKTFSSVSMLYMLRPPKTVMAEYPTSNGALLITSVAQGGSGYSATYCDHNIKSLLLVNGTVYTGTRIVIYGEEW